MKIAPGRPYWVGYVRELGLIKPRLRTQLAVSDVYQYKGVICVYGMTSSYQVHVPELRGVSTVPPRPVSFALPAGDLEPFVIAGCKALMGEDLYLEDGETGDVLRLLNTGVCRKEPPCSCRRYHGPIDPTAWTQDDHRKKNVYMVDRFLAMKESGELMRSILQL